MNREHKKHVAELDLIRQRIKAVRVIVADIEDKKDGLVVAAAAGDGNAIRTLDRLRAAELELADLVTVEPIALAAVSQDERVAKAEQERQAADKLKRSRIAVADRIDVLGRDLLATIIEHQTLGEPLSSGTSQGMSHYEEVRGSARLLAALQPLVRKLQPNAVLPERQMPMGQSERVLWQLPNVEPEAA
jgi:hypothetical protein